MDLDLFSCHLLRSPLIVLLSCKCRVCYKVLILVSLSKGFEFGVSAFEVSVTWHDKRALICRSESRDAQPSGGSFNIQEYASRILPKARQAA